MRRRRGFALMLALLISTLLLVLGIGFMTKQSYRYRLARLSADAIAAKSLAMAGIENSRVKMQHDLLYPPPDDRYHDEYSFSEPVYDLNSSRQVGTYEVTVDRRWMELPYEVIIITSVGHPVDSNARYSIRAELDVSESRGTFFQIVRLEENSAY
ncbi:MAG: hypothetical protein J0I12_09835 [Candidatus Eremiobacteraeota bacterium]|nr:hypothetical protein [Candidatus Eremiobacteraeota bacterium]